MKIKDYIIKNLPNLNWNILPQIFEENDVELTEEIEAYLRNTPGNTNWNMLSNWGISGDESSEGGVDNNTLFDKVIGPIEYIDDAGGMEYRIQLEAGEIETLENKSYLIEFENVDNLDDPYNMHEVVNARPAGPDGFYYIEKVLKDGSTSLEINKSNDHKIRLRGGSTDPTYLLGEGNKYRLTISVAN